MSNAAMKERFAVGSQDWVRAEAQVALSGGNTDGAYAWVRDVFPDAVIVEIELPTGATLYRMPYTVDGDEITFADLEETSIEYVAKRRESADGIELAGPIVSKSASRQIAYAAVLVPGEEDSDGDVLTAEKVEQVAHSWLADYGNVDLQHSLNNVATPVESYLLTDARTVQVAGKSLVLPTGTWILGSRIDDAGTWAAVEKGELTGYSIMGVRRAALKQHKGVVKSNTALKRTKLADLGDDWVAPFVSVVDAPAVPKAKFFALKEAAPTEKPSLWKRLTASAKSQQTGDDDMKIEEIQEAVATAIKEAVPGIEATLKESIDAIGARLDKVEKAAAEAPPVIELEPANDPPAEDPAIKAITERMDKLETAIKSTSRALPSDETVAAEKADEGPKRDAFGRRVL